MVNEHGGYPGGSTDPQTGNPWYAGGPPDPPKPPWYKRPLVWVLLIAVALLAFSCAGMAVSVSNSINDDLVTGPTPSVLAPPPAKKSTWHKVSTLSGSGINGSSEDFTVKQGAKYRLAYNVRSDDPVLFAAYVLKSGTDLNTDGGIPVVTLTDPKKSTIALHVKPGTYYVAAVSSVDYTITVEELS